MKIRKATVKDWKTLRDLNHSLWVYEYDNFEPVWNTKFPLTKEGEGYYKRILRNDKEWCIFFAEEKGDVKGYVVGTILTWDPTFLKDVKALASLEHMLVKDDHRHKGIGKKLVEKFFEWADEKEANRIEVKALAKNPRTIKFYKSLGFEDFEVILIKKKK